MSYDRPMGHDDAFRRNEMIADTVFAARKSGLTAYLLWIFLGGVGMHNFYLGRVKAGGLQMAGTLFVYCTYVSDDAWPLVGMIASIPLGISLLIDLFCIPRYVVDHSQRVRARLEDDQSDWNAA